MQLSSTDLAAFDSNGVLLVRGLFDAAEVVALKKGLHPILTTPNVRRVLEGDGLTVRSVFGPHQLSPVGNALARSVRMLGCAKQLLRGDVYIYQSKYNVKAPLRGDVWEWHQDYTFWQQEDGVPRAEMLSAMVFLDEATEQNAPLLVMPGTHRGQLLAEEVEVAVPEGSGDQPWLSTHTAALKYHISDETLRAAARDHGILSMTGPAGSVCFFHAGLIHGSTVNITPYGRAAVFTTYNRVDNAPDPKVRRRPHFISEENTAAPELCDEASLRRMLQLGD